MCQHAMDAQHRKCNREHEGIPEAPQARSSAAGPLPSQPVGELPTTTTFCRRGMCLVRLGNSATLHLSVLDAHAVRAVLLFHFLFFSLLFHGFPTAIAKEANVRNSHFLGDPRAKTVLNWSSRNPEVQFCFPVCSKALKTLLYKEPITFDDLKIVREISGQHVRNILEVDKQDSTVGGQRAQHSLSEGYRNLLSLNSDCGRIVEDNVYSYCGLGPGCLRPSQLMCGAAPDQATTRSRSAVHPRH